MSTKMLAGTALAALLAAAVPAQAQTMSGGPDAAAYGVDTDLATPERTAEQDGYLREWAGKMDEMSEDAAEDASENAAAAWTTLSGEWEDLKAASADEWDDATRAFEGAYDAFVTETGGDSG